LSLVPFPARPLICYSQRVRQEAGAGMILTIVIVLVVLWLLGMVSTGTLGGWLHVLLVIAVIFLLIGVIRGRGL
jgi:uncharacterized membrane protein